ncbi:MAG: NlpC/P60 family protein [Fimbriimonadaceae bacterium]|nr:NlpC/P60 family protein [Fimbriimonadaceae bacterium]
MLIAIAAGVLLATNISTSPTTYSIKEGDTLSLIAARHNVTVNALVEFNHLENPHKLALGTRINIPTPKKSPSVSLPTGKYRVSEGENDWTIARKFGASVSEIHRLNPGVKWTKLQLGQILSVPTVKSVAGMALASANKAKKPTGYSVVQGDNDWIIARKLGSTPSKLRAANPGVVWTRLQIGQKLNLPGGVTAVSLKNPAINTRHAKIIRDSVNIRRGPGTQHATVTIVGSGTQVTVLDRDGDWYKLKFPKGTVGWVRGDMLKPLSATAVARSSSTRNPRSIVAKSASSAKSVAYNAKTGNSLVDKALSLQGIRYRYGGMSRSGTDCSGFTSMVFAEHGIKLPRTSGSQAGAGSKVDKGSLKPGDLVFFKTSRSSRINHVGIYIGSGKFVHASSAKGRVRTDSLSDGYYSNRYVTARRVAGGSVAAKEEAKPAAKPAAKPDSAATDKSGPEAKPPVKPEEKPASTGIGADPVSG